MKAPVPRRVSVWSTAPYNGRMDTDKGTPYAGLTPDCVLDALDSIGLRGDGRLLGLNSYENRVYQLWLEDEPGLTLGPGLAPPVVVAKFYRPGRWSDAQIR